MFNTKISGSAKLRTLLLALSAGMLSAVLLPVAAGQGPSAMPKARTLKSVDAQTRDHLLEKIQMTVDAMRSAFGRRDLSAYLAHFTSDAISLPQEHEALVGKGALHKQAMEDQNKGITVHGFKVEGLRLWVSGDFVYEIGPYAMALSTPGVPGMITDFRSGLTIWERQADGSLKIKVDAYSRDAVPKDPMDFGADTSAEDIVVQAYSGPQLDSEGQTALFSEIRRIEKAFHQLFLEKNAPKATSHYTEDATLMVMGYPVLHGKDAIGETIEKGVRETPLTALKRDIIQIDGDSNMVYVVNLFRWTVKDPSSGQESTLPGKGVHVWQRQPNDSWKIVIDINNLDISL